MGFSGFSYLDHTNDIVKFKLAFLVKPFDTVNANQMKVKSSPLFGEVIGGKNVLEELSKVRLSDRSGFKVLISFDQVLSGPIVMLEDDENDD